MLGVLLGGPVLALLRRGGRLADRGLRRVPGALGAGVRLVVFALVMASLGGLVAFAVLSFATLEVP